MKPFHPFRPLHFLLVVNFWMPELCLKAAERPNVLLMAVDDLCAEPGCNDANHIHSLNDPTRRTKRAVLAQYPVHAVDQSHQSGPSKAVIGFEKMKPGPFTELKTTIGIWKRTAGATLINNKHARTGQQCLQLAGGASTRVTLDLIPDADTSGELAFWAERWTKRAPFSFRIEQSAGNGWREIYNGDDKIRVGRAFLSQVRVPLGDAAIRRLRFTVESPPGTGILIDDLRLAPAQPQKIVQVEALPLTLPAIAGTKASPLLRLRIETKGFLQPISVTELTGKLRAGKNATETVRAYYDGASGRFSATEPFGKPHEPTEGKNNFTFIGEQELVEGMNEFWIAARLSDDANIDGRIGAAWDYIRFSNGKTMQLDTKPSYQRLGVAVRSGGDDGVHTYRIPGLARTKKGTLIGVYDVRHRSGRDLPGDIDVGMSRSTNGGITWEPMRIIMDMGDDPDWHYDGIGDPAVLVDEVTDTIWVAATWSHGNRSWRGSGPGLKPEETGQLMLVRSNDDGMTWSKPINITRQVKRPEWCFILQGPGKGITMRDGTLVFPAQYQDPPGKKRLPHSTIIYSKDRGRTWTVGTGAFDDTTEAQVVEIEPGILMLNCRYNRKAARVVMTTRDMGKTWQKHPTSERALIEPRACMASLIDADRETGENLGGWLLFSNPNSLQERHHITIKASPDRGMTWPKANHLLLDEGRGAGYSCMAMIDARTIGILYEGSRAHMTFQRIPLQDVIGDKPPPSSPSRGKEPVSSGQSHPMPQVIGEVNLFNRTDPAASPFTTECEAKMRTELEPGKNRPNILFIVSEDNGDHLGCYGEPRVHTPHLDALATGGVRYARAYVPYSVCSPSRASFLTGLYTRQTGHIDLATHRFSMFRDFKTMPAWFREAGYYTGFLGKTHVNPERLVEDHIDHRAIPQSNFGKIISIQSYAEETRAVIRNAAAQNKP